MRKSMLILALSFVSTLSFAEAEPSNNNLFKCVESKELTLNAECLSQTIENNVQFKDFQVNFHSEMGELGGNAMATMQFYPELMEIHIIAHDDDKASGALVQQQSEQAEQASGEKSV